MRLDRKFLVLVATILFAASGVLACGTNQHLNSSGVCCDNVTNTVTQTGPTATCGTSGTINYGGCTAVAGDQNNNNATANGGAGGSSSSDATGGAGGNATGGNSNATGGSSSAVGSSQSNNGINQGTIAGQVANGGSGGQGGAGGAGGSSSAYSTSESIAAGGTGNSGTIQGGTGGNATDNAKNTVTSTNVNTPVSNSSANNNGNGNGNGNGSNNKTMSTSSANNNGNLSNVGNASATGGAVKNSGNSKNTVSTNISVAPTQTVSDSGNSSQKQGQTQSSTSSASNNGNGSNNATYSSVENVAASKIPVATAYAPVMGPTASCFKPFGGGVQTAPVGLSFGSGRIDSNCVLMEDARSFAESGSRLAYCKIMLTKKEVKKAGITMEDCLAQPQPEAVVVPVQVSQPATVVVPPPAVVIPTPAAIVEIPTPIQPEPRSSLVGICSFAEGAALACAKDQTSSPQRYPGVACKRMLDEAVSILSQNPSATLQIITAGSNKNVVSVARSNNVLHFFIEHGISTRQIQQTFEPFQTARTVELRIVR